MDRRRAAGVLLALAACVAYATAAPTASNHTSLDLYDGAPDGCYYNFQHYGEGDRIMTNEPCLNCTCHNRMLMCYLRVCPFTKPIGQDCTIEKRADQCCPIVTCPDVPVDLLTSTTTSPAEYGATGLGKLDKYGCSIHGKYFPEGSKVPPMPNKPCEHCYCIRNMTTCVMQECTLHVDGCTPIYHKDVCCPVRYSCDHPEDEMPLLDDLSTTVRPTPGFLLTTTTLSPVTQMSQDCLYENQIISDGALIKTEKACDHCYCMKGDIVCVVQECGTPMENEGKNCTALAPREGVCCPDTYICEGDEPTTGTYESLDYTTELEKLTTLSPPRRAGSEGSGYRNEPDGIPNTESPTFETETEGSGYEQATIHPTDVTEALLNIKPSDETSSSTGEPNEFIAFTTTKETVLDHAGVTTESDVSQQKETLQSTTNTYISQKIDESSTTIAQDEDIGSGEEDVITPYDLIPTPSIEVSEPTKVTTESYTENDFEKKPTISSSMIDGDKTIIPKEQSVYTDDSAIDITTETRRHLDDDQGVKASTAFDEKYHATEHDSLQTTSIPIINEDERGSSTTSEHDMETIDAQHYTTLASSFEDEITTTESQDGATGSFEGTSADVDLSHQITITSSTPLLEEIEKDTADQENIPDESTLDGLKTSTILSNLQTEEAIYKDSSKPDLTEEIVVSNIPTTVSTFENIDVTTGGPQTTQETEDSSEAQHYVPTTIVPVVFDEETKKPSLFDSISTPEPQKTEIEESSEPEQYAPTTYATATEDETHSVTTLATLVDEINETQETSEPQTDAFVTNAPTFEDNIKTSTLSESITPSKAQNGSKVDLEESSEPQQYAPTTSASLFDDKTKETTSLDYINTSKAQEDKETDVEESSEPQQYGPTTSAPLLEDNIKETTSLDFINTSKAQEEQETDVKESSEPQQYGPTTTVSTIEAVTKKATPYDLITTVKMQDGQESDYENSSEPQQYSPITGIPALEDETKKLTSSDYMTTSAIPERQGTEAEESSEPQQYGPTTSVPVFKDEAKKTTLSDLLTTPKNQENQETDLEEDLKTTTGPVIEDKTTTPSDSITSSMTQEDQKMEAETSSEPQQYDSSTSAPTFEDEFKKTTPSKTEVGQETDIKESSEPQQYDPITTVSAIEAEPKETTLSDSITTPKTQEERETDVEAGSETEQYAPTTSEPIFEHEAKETTPSDSITTSKKENDQEIDVEATSEPQQYAPTTIAPIFVDESKKTPSPVSMITSETQEDQKPAVEEGSEPQQYGSTTSASSFEDKITTVEPDKGLNTIPSGLVEEETTEYPEKHSYTNEMIPTESAVELELSDKLSDKTESDTFIHSTSTPDTSTFMESTMKENDDRIVSIETHDIGITEPTTVLADVSEEVISTVAHDHRSSTEAPTTEYQEVITSTFSTETVKQTADSKEPDSSTYASSSQATELEHATSERHEAVTSSPSYDTISSSTTADLEENEIINESRIPGEGDCLLNGVTYRNESAVPSINKCQSGCRCSSSIIKCDPIICSPPPEYMDNCQTTYDSLDSCCPTYVCDHKTETMPPQSHSQMSGTDAPEVAPVKCNGDKCVLSEDENHADETPEPCKSGTCISQDKISSHPSNIPVLPTVDHHEECTGDKCTSPDSTDQLLCSDKNGCQASPVQPCQGNDCEVTSDSTLPQKQQPCADGENCDKPVKDCSAGKCDSNSENTFDIEKECTEKSCKRKDDSDLETPPKQCLGSECQSTDLDLKENFNIVTEKEEKPSVSLSPTEIFVTTKPIENITNEPDQYVTVQTSIGSQPLPTTTLSDITTKQPDLESVMGEISTIYESVTPSENLDKTKYFDTEMGTKTPTTVADTSYVTEKLEDDMTTEAGNMVRTDSPDLSFDKESTTEFVKETETHPTKMQSTEIEKVTQLPIEINDQKTTTSFESIPEATTIPAPQLPEKESAEDAPTSVLDEIFTKPPKTQSETDDARSTESSVDSDIKPQEVTKSPNDTNDDTSAIYDMDEFTKLPQVSDVKETTANINENNDNTTPKTYDSDSHETTVSPQSNISDDMIIQITDVPTTKTPESHITDLEEVSKTTKESLNEEPTVKPTSEFATVPELSSDNRETTKLPEKSDSTEITNQYIEKYTTELSKLHDSDKTEVTESPEITQGKITTTPLTDDFYTEEDATKKSTVTEPLIDVETEKIATKPSGENEFTTMKIVDEISHETTTTQHDSETEVSLVSKFNDEIGTEPSKPNDSESFDTTKSPDEFDMEITTIKVTKETEIDPTKSVDFKPQTVTGSDSVLLLDVTTTKSSEDEHTLSSESHLLEKSTTLQPDIASELTTQFDLGPDSMSTKPERTDVNEITSGIQEDSQTTQSIIDSFTESIEKATSTLSVSLIPVSDHDILTESPLDLVTKAEAHHEVTVSSDKPSGDGETTATETDTSITDKTVTQLPQEQDTKNRDEDRETTKPSMDLDEMTLKPTTALDDKIQEDINTKAPVLLETERDTVYYEVTTLKPRDATDTINDADIKTEQPEIIVPPGDKHQEETLNETTIAEKVTTALPIALETELPVEESYTGESLIHDHKPTSTETSEIDTPEKDESETETPFSDELTTVASQYEDKLIESSNQTAKEPEMTQHQDFNTMPTESEKETYTKEPLRVSSEAVDQDSSYTSNQIADDDLTTPAIKISEPTTEPSDILTHIPTESSSIHIVDTDKPIETTQETQSSPESSTSRDSTEDKITESVVTEISTVQESITKEQLSADVFSTESPKETYTEASEKPEIKDTKDTEMKTPEQAVFESTEIEPAEQTTKAQDQEDNEFVDLATGTKDFDSTSTSPSVIKTTKEAEATETNTQLLEMITSEPGEDIVKPTSTHQLFETTTSSQVKGESISPVDKESTETPVTVSSQPTVDESETTTELIEEEFIPSRTGKPEMYPTTLSAAAELAKSTPSPVDEASTVSDQSPLTSIGSQETEGEQATTIVSDLNKTEIQVQTERVTTPTETTTPLQVEPSSETPQAEKVTTSKAEELTTASPFFDKFTKPYKHTEATEQPKPIPTEKQPTDDLPDEEPSIPPSGTSGYGSDPDYMEEDQTFGPGTCRYGGKVYVSAQQIPRDDPCDFCFCFRSDIICLQQSCPPPIHGCHEEPISGFCCPRYECPVSMATTVNVTTTTTTTTTTVPPHFPVHSYKGSAQKRGCLIKGHTYKVGEVVRASSGPCLHCTCGGDGQMKCDPKQCTPEPMLRQMIAAAVSAKRRR